ncbi:MAG: SOS response-associated peptidase family protein [Verrucomicrobiales bacterium]
MLHLTLFFYPGARQSAAVAVEFGANFIPMCNLYDIGTSHHRKNDEWEAAVSKAIGEFRKTHGIRKTDPGMVVTLGDSGPGAKVMRWGYQRSFNPAVNNARSDKLDGMWSESWQARRRCLIPVQTFYEWTGSTGKKQTFAFEADDPESRLWAAGIWEPGDDEPAYSMLTTSASESISPIHDRMPALLSPKNFEEFLTSEDPRDLLTPTNGGVEIYRCENPLSNPGEHTGPVRQDLLPGFDGI